MWAPKFESRNHVTCCCRLWSLLPSSPEILLYFRLLLVPTGWTIQNAIKGCIISFTVMYLTIWRTRPASRHASEKLQVGKEIQVLSVTSQALFWKARSHGPITLQRNCFKVEALLVRASVAVLAAISIRSPQKSIIFIIRAKKNGWNYPKHTLFNSEKKALVKAQVAGFIEKGCQLGMVARPVDKNKDNLLQAAKQVCLPESYHNVERAVDDALAVAAQCWGKAEDPNNDVLVIYIALEGGLPAMLPFSKLNIHYFLGYFDPENTFFR